MRIFQKPCDIGKLSALTFAMVTAIGLSIAVSATPASASTFYPINQADATHACSSTYTIPSYETMLAIFPAGASTWDCYGAIWVGYYNFWALVQNLGAPDLQKYCSVTYPGSRAVMVSPNYNGWYCEL